MDDDDQKFDERLKRFAESIDTVEYWEFRLSMKMLGKTIDPATAITGRRYVPLTDPYEYWPGVSESEFGCQGKVYFARDPESEIWIADNDLPAETFAALKEQNREYGELSSSEREPRTARDEQARKDLVAALEEWMREFDANGRAVSSSVKARRDQAFKAYEAVLKEREEAHMERIPAVPFN